MSQAAQPSSSSDMSAVAKRGHSVIWTHFERTAWQTGKNGVKIAKCLQCEHSPFQLNNGTTNSLWRHLENEHRDIFREMDSENKRKKARVEVDIYISNLDDPGY